MLYPNHPLFSAARLRRLVSPETLVSIEAASAILSAFLVLVSVLTETVLFVGLAAFALAVFIKSILLRRFLQSYIGRSARPLTPASERELISNLEQNWPYAIDFDLARMVSETRNPDSEKLFEAFLKSEGGAFFLERIGVSLLDLSHHIAEKRRKTTTAPTDFSTIATASAELAIAQKRRQISSSEVVAALLSLDPALQDALQSFNLQTEDILKILWWYELFREHHRARFLSRILATPPIGREWAYGFTPFLNRFASEIGGGPEDEHHMLAHPRELALLEETLIQSEHKNAILIGDPGVGKMTAVRGLAERIRQGRSLGSLNYLRVITFHMEDALGASGENLPGVIGRALTEAQGAGNIILIIPDIDLYLAPSSKTGIAELLLPFLRSPYLRVIGTTTGDGYAKSASTGTPMASLFREIRLGEPEKDATMGILCDRALTLERVHGVHITYPALKAVYTMAERYIAGEPFPAKGVKLLDEAFSRARTIGQKIIDAGLIETIIETRFGADVGETNEAERDTLMHLEARIHERVVNQERAIAALGDAMRRKRAGVAGGGKPAGTFLFLGPTGVGKTETARALAEVSFGSDEKMIRLDMAEFQNPSDIARLIGGADGAPGLLATQIRATPFSLILLDEIEKAHPTILNLFLRILDEGKATDGAGKLMDFRNTIIIGTSNAGSEFIREAIKSEKPYAEIQRELTDVILRERIFAPEFVNRFDGVIVYTPLSKTHVEQVVHLLLGRLGKRLGEQGFTLSWSEEDVRWLAENGYSPVFGGRELNRVIQNEIEAPIAKDILAGRYKPGDTIQVPSHQTNAEVSDPNSQTPLPPIAEPIATFTSDDPTQFLHL